VDDIRSMRFPADAARLAEVRDFAVAATREIGASVDVDVVKVLVGEMAANAALHQAGEAELSVETLADGGVVLSVTDSDPVLPRLYDGEPWDVEGHRGMKLIDALSDGWGIEPVGTGKRVWAWLRTATGSRSRSADAEL